MAAIQLRSGSDRPLLVGIDGAGGAGKSALAASLRAELAGAEVRCAVVHMDDFFLPSSVRPGGGPMEKPIGGDFDWQRVRVQVLVPFRSGLPVRYQRYDWDSDAMAEWVDLPETDLLIVEGIYSTRAELEGLYHLRVWVETPIPLRLARGIERDGEAARGRWESDWIPCEERYIAAQRPQDRADFIIAGWDVTV